LVYKNLTKLSAEYLHKIKVPMRLTLDDQQIFDSSLNCSICHKALGTDRVRDSRWNFRITIK